MCKCSLEIKEYEFSLNAEENDVYKGLHHLTDEDYNGLNGLYLHSTGGHTYSKLELDMFEYEKCDNLVKFIKDILSNCYKNTLYKEYKIVTKIIYDTIIVVVSCLKQ